MGLAERTRLLGGSFTSGARSDGGWSVTAELPLAPGSPAPVTDTERHRRSAQDRVHRSGRRAVLVSVAVGVAAVALVAGYMVADAVTSVLDPGDFDRLRPGTGRAAAARVLPVRTRTDDPETGVPIPTGAECDHYGTHANPFDARRADLFRLCFRDGVLVSKDLIVRGR